MKHRSAVLCGQARVVHSVSECVSTSMRRYFEVENRGSSASAEGEGNFGACRVSMCRWAKNKQLSAKNISEEVCE